MLQGSGQGQIISGDFADNTFLHPMEVNFCALESVQRKYNIDFYGRYRDDILIVAHDEGVVGFFAKMKDLSKDVSPLHCDEVSSSRLHFLDVVIFKGPMFDVTGKISYKPFCKPTNPLHFTLAHSPSIHAK